MCKQGTGQIQQQMQKPRESLLKQTVQKEVVLENQDQAVHVGGHNIAKLSADQQQEQRKVSDMIAHGIWTKAPETVPGSTTIDDLHSRQEVDEKERWTKLLHELRPDLQNKNIVFMEGVIGIDHGHVAMDHDLHGEEDDDIIDVKDEEIIEVQDEEIGNVQEEGQAREEVTAGPEMENREMQNGDAGEGNEAERDMRFEMESYAEQFAAFTEQMKLLDQSGRYSPEELKMRLDCFTSVYGTLSDGIAPQRHLQLLDDRLQAKYDDTQAEFQKLLTSVTGQRQGEKTEIQPEIQLEEQLKERYQKIDDNAGKRLDRGSLTGAQVKAVCAIDQWLIESLTKRKDGMEHAEIFRLLNRSMRERLFAYYLIENGYQEKVSEITVIDSQTGYTPDTEKIKEAGFHLSKLGNVYQNTAQASSLISALGEYDTQWKEKTSENTVFYQYRELGIMESLGRVKPAIEALKEKTKAYESCSRIHFLKKRKLKKELENAKKHFYGELAGLLTQIIRNVGAVKSVDYAKGPAFYSGKELVGDAMLSATGLKVAGVLGAAATGSVGTIYGANTLGGLIGMVSLLTAALQVSKIKAGFAAMSEVNQIGAWMDFSNTAISPIHSMATSASGIAKTFFAVQFESISKTGTAAEVGAAQAAAATAATAGKVIAGAGIMLGTFSTVTGGYKLANISSENDQRERASERFEQLRKKKADQKELLTEEEALQTRQTERYEDHILKIQQRINRRKSISAGCQIVSGTCAMLAGTMAMTGQAVAAGVFGVVGFTASVTGIVVNRILKRREYETVVDEFLGVEDMAKNRYIHFKQRTGKEPTGREQKKIREQLRKEMMALCGFTSVKAFYANIMKIYAVQICSKLQNVLADPDAVPTDEQKAYLDIVESLGLKIERTTKEAERFPTVAMVFQKLMS